MRKNSIKPIKIPLAIQQILLILIGFAAGYTANQFVDPVHPQLQQGPYQPPAYLKEGAASVCFTPNKKCQSQIIGEINKAKESIFVQAYSFTDRDIAQALVGATKRGVHVQVILDKSNRNDKSSAKDMIIQNNLPLRFDSPSGIAHNKIMIIDEAIVLSGSYNFSAAAHSRNTENLLILNSPSLAKEYLQNWQKRWEVSKE
jgi:phosphatidylserine/phosphatidylglycerophosphate/cardiolipin synthase-like enzyme